MAILPPFNLQRWIDEHRHLLKPPVASCDVYAPGDFFVLVIGGPNRRNDFHVGPGEELYYQVEGEADILYLDAEGRRQVAHLGPGDMWLLPAWVPHRPQRKPNSVGLVVERKRRADELDRFGWHCEQCGLLLHEVKLHLAEMENLMKPMMETFYADEGLRTCKRCGSVLPVPKPYGVP